MNYIYRWRTKEVVASGSGFCFSAQRTHWAGEWLFSFIFQKRKDFWTFQFGPQGIWPNIIHYTVFGPYYIAQEFHIQGLNSLQNGRVGLHLK